MEHENRSFWGILVWVTVLTGGLFGLEGMLMKVTGDWISIIYPAILTLCTAAQIIRHRKTGDSMQDDPLKEVLFVATGASYVFRWVVLSEKVSAFAWWFVPPLVLLESFALYKDAQKRAKDRQEAEQRRQEPHLVLARELKSAQKVFILISHAEKVPVLFRVTSQMLLYTLADGRFLILFKQPVTLETLRKSIATFRAKVPADEDVIGFYGPAADGSATEGSFAGDSGTDSSVANGSVANGTAAYGSADGPATVGFGQAYVSTLAGECRPIPFDPDTVPLAEAVPVW